jgi:hypothetical protein
LSQPDAPIDDATVDADAFFGLLGLLGLRSLTGDAAIGQFFRFLPFRGNTD